MRDGDRPTLCNLFTEFWNHAACATQNVAETYHDKICFLIFIVWIIIFGNRNRLLQRLAHHFRQSLAGTHDIGRIDRFIGGDQDEFFYPVPNCRLCQDISSPYIIQHGLPSILLLHQWNMLVSSCMKNNGHLKLRKYLIQSSLVFDIAYCEYHSHFRETAFEFLLHVVKREFVQLE